MIKIISYSGSPDFYFFKDGQLTVIEVKAGSDDLSFFQKAIRDFLVSHKVRFIIEYVKNNNAKTVFDSAKQSKLS